MSKLKVLELFGGIGACSKALAKIGVDYEIADYVEIDKYAVASFNAMHGTNFEPQDITKWDKDIKVDLIMHGSPCQDFSLAGKQAGGDKDSGTRSSLMYETIRIVEKLKPKYVIWENVKNLLSQKHRHNFDAYLETMNELGYESYYQVLNAKDYGIPQNRERVFTISIRKPKPDEIITIFEFPETKELKLKLKDMLENNVDEKYYLSDKQIRYLEDGKYQASKPSIKLKQTSTGIAPTLDTMQGGNRQPLIYATNKSLEKTINENELNKEINYLDTYNNNVRNDDLSGTITTGVSFRNNTFLAIKSNNEKAKNMKQDLCDYLIANNKVKENDMIRHSYTTWRKQKEFHTENSRNNNNLRIRKLTPKECWRLMGFDDEDFEKAQKVNSNAQLYKQAGNSIVVNVLMAIFKELI